MARQRGIVIRLHRTTAELPKFVPVPHHTPGDIYDPWFCVACGHPHHGMTRHHRLPRRIAWKIQESVWVEALNGDQRVVPMCGPCHTFIENRRGHPCLDRPNKKYALLSWKKLMDEIDLFDRIAYERTEALIQKMKK